MRYYLDVYHDESVVRDPEGREFETMEEARLEALASAREMMAASLVAGQFMFDRSIRVRNEQGDNVSVLRFEDALPARVPRVWG